MNVRGCNPIKAVSVRNAERLGAEKYMIDYREIILDIHPTAKARYVLGEVQIYAVQRELSYMPICIGRRCINELLAWRSAYDLLERKTSKDSK